MDQLSVQGGPNDQSRAKSFNEGPGYAINDDAKPSRGALCKQCLQKEGGADKNMDVMSNGSQRDDVSQSTMARSNKPFSEGRGGEMNATMTTIDGSERGAPRMVSSKSLKNTAWANLCKTRKLSFVFHFCSVSGRVTQAESLDWNLLAEKDKEVLGFGATPSQVPLAGRRHIGSPNQRRAGNLLATKGLQVHLRDWQRTRLLPNIVRVDYKVARLRAKHWFIPRQNSKLASVSTIVWVASHRVGQSVHGSWQSNRVQWERPSLLHFNWVLEDVWGSLPLWSRHPDSKIRQHRAHNRHPSCIRTVFLSFRDRGRLALRTDEIDSGWHACARETRQRKQIHGWITRWKKNMETILRDQLRLGD